MMMSGHNCWRISPKKRPLRNPDFNKWGAVSLFVKNHSTAMQNNHFHSYITPANESAYRGVPDHLLDFPARNERAAALERERLERERKAREAHEQFQRQQEANARALQGMGSPQAYTPQYTPPSTYGTSQPVSWPQPQRQQPKRSVAPTATLRKCGCNQ